MVIYSFDAARLKREAARYRSFSECDPGMRSDWLAMAEQLESLARDYDEAVEGLGSGQTALA
jgi:hypothetical protein